MAKPLDLPFDPIERAAEIWGERFGPADAMAAVTSIMRAQQILLAGLDGLLRPYGLTFARYEALVLLAFSRRGALPLRVTAGDFREPGAAMVSAPGTPPSAPRRRR